MRNRLWLVGLGVSLGLVLRMFFGSDIDKKPVEDGFHKQLPISVEKEAKLPASPPNNG